MEDTTKKVEETTEPEAPQEETNDTKEEEVQGTNAESSEVDYKAELEKAKKQISQAEYTIQEEKRRRREAERLAEETVEPKPDVEEDRLRQIIREEQSAILSKVREGDAKRIARSMSSNDVEYELILHHYENSIRPTGDIESDIRRAKLLANEARYASDIEEARRSALSASMKGKGTGSGQKLQDKKTPNLTTEERKLARVFGLTPDEIAKAKQEEISLQEPA